MASFGGQMRQDLRHFNKVHALLLSKYLTRDWGGTAVGLP
jgi:hypothetical protein